MHLAVTHGHLEALDMICRAGVNLNVQEGTFGRTPLHLAVEKGSITATMIILQAVSTLLLIATKHLSIVPEPLLLQRV